MPLSPLCCRRRVLRRVLPALLTVCAAARGARAADQPAQPSFEVFWKHTATIPLAGVTRAVVLDDSICQAEVAANGIRLTGIGVGDTVVFAWIDGMRTTRVVRVIPEPEKRQPRALSAAAADARGRGRVGSAVMFGGAAASSPVVTHEYWDWQQKRADAKLTVRGFADTYSGGAHPFNLSSVSVQHATATRTLSLMDFTLNLGAEGTAASSLAQFGGLAVRGADFAATRGRTSVELFGGTTVPPFFLELDDTRTIVGGRISRTLSQRLTIFDSAGVVRGTSGTAPSARTESTPFNLAGLHYRRSARTTFRAVAGTSSSGSMGDVAAETARGPFTASLAATQSSSAFPLNRLQALTTAESSVRGMAGAAWSWLSATTFARRAVSGGGTFAALGGRSDTVSQNVQLTLPRHQQFSVNALRDVSEATLFGGASTRRLDAAWSSPIGPHVSNSLQAGVATRREGDRGGSREFSFRDSATFSFAFGSLAVAVERQRTDPSALARVRQILDRLPTALQEVFQADPAIFLETVDLPSDVRQILERIQPTSTSASIGAQVARGRLAVSPNVSLAYDSGAGATRRSVIAGYTATFQLSPTWQIRSALTNRFLYAGPQHGFRRTNVMTFALDKTLNGLPRWMASATQSYTIEGRVFRDNTVNGVFDPVDVGLAGIRVRLDNGRIAVTDAAGRFRFKKVQPGLRHLSLDLAQFGSAVRVTTPTEVDVEVVDRDVQVGFGVVNFARLLGAVFNDYHNDGMRQSDAPGLAGITVRITGPAFEATTETDGSGEFEVPDLPPGDYRVTIRSEDLPADYVAAAESQQVHVDALSTAIADIPARALRSIAGHLLFRSGGEGSTALQPLEGVVLTAGDARAVTDAEGRYILRNLPAGSVEVRVITVGEVPQHLRAPSGVVRLPSGPIRLDTANIVITNPELVPYVVPGQPGQPAQGEADGNGVENQGTTRKGGRQ